jgi:type II secretory pathway component GspD/PulD (secretin)
LTSNPNDFVELKYIVPSAQPGVKVTSGTFRIPSATNVITASYSTVNTDISVGSVVKVYNPTFPDTFFVDTVTASNTTTLTVSSAVSNNDLQGSGLNIDVITDKNSAFRNNQNYNIVRYFNKSLAKYDGFKVFAVKIVLLSSASYLVPRVEEYRAIAVSA